MGRKADALFSLIVRARGGCVAAGRLVVTTVGEDGELIATEDHACAGPLQCAHIVSRTYRSTRWDFHNAFPLCAGAHVWYTHHPIEWERFVVDRIGRDGLDMLKAQALRKWDGDLEIVLVRLAARAVALGIPANPGAARPEEGAK